MTEEAATENNTTELTEEEKSFLIQKGLLLDQLLQSAKFVQFISSHYDVVMNEEDKTVYVIEVPHEVALQRLTEAIKADAQAEKMQQGDDGSPVIVPASEADLKALERK